jgi:Fic family protein
MGRRATGTYVTTTTSGEAVAAFVPFPLPPQNPALTLDDDLLSAALQALGRLDLAGDMVPSLDWFIYAFVRKEAVVTSQIEGTQATLIDLLSFEAEEGAIPSDEVEDVTNYLDALTFARTELASETGLPLSMRLLNEAHRRLLRGARGANKMPGEIRRSQNWLGGTRPGNAAFVPPPPEHLPELLTAFERYLHTDDVLPPLVRAGLAHVQFETIHPYLDGNGRIGRLLVALLLEHWKILTKPLLYLSLYFKRHRDEYYARLSSVRTDGDWEGWTSYFLQGVASVADEAVGSARKLFSLVTHDRLRMLEHATSSVAAIRLFEVLPKHPILTIATAMKLLGTTKPTASRAVDALIASGVLRETTGRKRDRSFAYDAYLDVLRVGTELDA